jgi:hypothetical protein
MSNVWQRFQDPTWRKAAESRPQNSMGMAWGIKKTDTKELRKHKLTVKDWLFKNNLTEELLLNHPSPDDIKLLQEIRISHIYDYFAPSDIGMLNAIEDRIVLKRKSLTLTHRAKIEHAVIRAQRLYTRNIPRKGFAMNNNNKEYQQYKQKISGI